MHNAAHLEHLLWLTFIISVLIVSYHVKLMLSGCIYNLLYIHRGNLILALEVCDH